MTARLWWALGCVAVLLQPGVGQARDALRVCADPNNLPFSHKDESGIENKLARLWADKLGVPLEYTWFPQRLGFLRNTINAPAADRPGFKCDVVMGWATDAEGVLTTRPYYRSTYALVYAPEHGLDDVKTGADFASLPDERKQKIRVSTFTPTPGATWLARHGYGERTVGYPVMSGDPAAYPGMLIDQVLLGGTVDAVVLWGPIAGYFAAQSRDVPLKVIPLESEPPDIQFEFSTSAAVRYADKDGKAELDGLIEQTREEIDVLLREYHFPVVPETGESKPDDDDD